MSDILIQQQKWLERSRAELLIAPDGRLNNWRHVIFNNECINSYFHPEFTHAVVTRHIEPFLPNEKGLICDFGSGSGHVARTVVEQLQASSGRIVSPFGVDNFDQDYWKENRPVLQIPTISGDLTDIPYKADTFHAGILRFVLPFIGKNNQPKVLEEISRVLKPGAVLVVLNDGLFTGGDTDYSWNAIFARCATVEGLGEMYYPSFERLQEMVRSKGFQTIYKEDLTDVALGYLSDQIAAQVIDKTLSWTTKREMRKGLKSLFEKWKENDPDQFEPAALRPKSRRVPWPMYNCVFVKDI